MIQTISLRNFQCHKKLSIDLDHPIVVLTGASDHGKSAVMRAIRWACQNYPAGNEFIRHGAAFCRVNIGIDDHTITRRIGDKNEYRLDGERYVAFGRDVPDAIAKLVNVTDDNFQGQLDPVYWFSLTPGQVSKELNRIINLGVIDGTLATLAGEVRKAKAVVDVTRQRLQEAKVTKAKLAHAPALAQRLQGLRELEADVARKTTQVGVIRDLLGDAVSLANRKHRLRNSLLGGRRALEAGAAWAAADARLGALRSVLAGINTQESKLCQIKERLSAGQRKLRMQKTCPMCGQPLPKK